MRVLRYLALLFLATPALAQTPPTYQSEINTLADRLAPSIKDSPHDRHAPAKLLIASFISRGNHPNLLGVQLADALSDALQTRLSPNTILSRKEFQDRLQSASVTPQDLQDSGVLEWQAAQAGATLVLKGTLQRSDQSFTLDVTLLTTADSKEITTASTELTVTPDDAKLFHAPIPWTLANPAFQCPAVAGKDGVSRPQCLHCYPPDYTDAARHAKWQGTVMLKISIDETGRPDAAIILRGAPYGLNEQSIRTVLAWQFAPLTKDDQPIRACVDTETSFRLY